VEVNPYLSQVEKLKHKVITIEQKLASHEKRIRLYDEQVKEVKKILAKEEAQSHGYANGIEELWKKITKQQMKTNIKRKRVKVLRCIGVFL